MKSLKLTVAFCVLATAGGSRAGCWDCGAPARECVPCQTCANGPSCVHIHYDVQREGLCRHLFHGHEVQMMVPMAPAVVPVAPVVPVMAPFTPVAAAPLAAAP